MAELGEAAIRLLSGRHVATLATIRPDGLIHLTAVWYLYRDGQLLVATSSRSRQFRNVESRPTASLMIDTRVPGLERGLTALGRADLIKDGQARRLIREIHERYLTPRALSDPHVEASFASHDDVVIRVSPSSWVSWDMAQLNAEFFEGKLSTESGYLFPLDDS